MNCFIQINPMYLKLILQRFRKKSDFHTKLDLVNPKICAILHCGSPTNTTLVIKKKYYLNSFEVNSHIIKVGADYHNLSFINFHISPVFTPVVD